MFVMKRHLAKAVGVLLALVLGMLAVQQGAERGLAPPWETLLTQPVTEWAGIPQESQEEIAQTQSVVAAPNLSAQNQPFRVAGQPPQSPAAVQPDPHTTKTPEGKEEITRAESTPMLETKALSSTVEILTEAHASPLSQKPPRVSLTENRAETKTPRVAGDPVRNGLHLPQLVARWDLAALEALLAGNYGLIVAQWNGQSYRAIPGNDSLVADASFVILTDEMRARLSNRAWPLNRKHSGQSWTDTRSRATFRALEQRFQQQLGGGRAGEIPVLSFFASAAFDAYLARKQLDAVTTMGIDLRDSLLARVSIITVGEILVTGGRPAYLIETVVVNGETRPWRDPERQILRAAGVTPMRGENDAND